MEQLDAQDLTLYLAYQHVKSLGLKNLKTQIFNLGVKAGLDLESVDCQTSVQDIVNKYKSFERKTETQAIDEHTNQLVYSYLNRANYTDVAEEFSKICRIPKELPMSENLETIIQSQFTILQRPKTKRVVSYGLTRKNGLIAGVDFVDTEEVKFSNNNSKGGAIVMTYKGKQYNFKRFQKSGLALWVCRKTSSLKCYGTVHFNGKTGMIMKENPHNDKDHTDKVTFSSGSGETAITYSKSREKTPVLHYQGYEYTKFIETSIDGRVRWRCRQKDSKKCKGFLWTRNGHIDGLCREHTHLPPDQPPVETPKSDRMLSSLFL